MTCDERLVERIRGVLKRTANVRERRMFGGVRFTVIFSVPPDYRS
jgi:hypothetical protein